MTVGWGLIAATFMLTAIGFAFFTQEMIGWAQFSWVMASGTAGGAVVRLIDKWH